MEHLFTDQHHGRPTFGGVIVMSVILFAKFLSNSDTVAMLTSVSLLVMTIYYLVQMYLMITKRRKENKSDNNKHKY